MPAFKLTDTEMNDLVQFLETLTGAASPTHAPTTFTRMEISNKNNLSVPVGLALTGMVLLASGVIFGFLGSLQYLLPAFAKEACRLKDAPHPCIFCALLDYFNRHWNGIHFSKSVSK